MNRENAEKLVTKTFNFPFNEDKYSEWEFFESTNRNMIAYRRKIDE